MGGPAGGFGVCPREDLCRGDFIFSRGGPPPPPAPPRRPTGAGGSVRAPGARGIFDAECAAVVASEVGMRHAGESDTRAAPMSRRMCATEHICYMKLG